MAWTRFSRFSQISYKNLSAHNAKILIFVLIRFEILRFLLLIIWDCTSEEFLSHQWLPVISLLVRGFDFHPFRLERISPSIHLGLAVHLILRRGPNTRRIHSFRRPLDVIPPLLNKLRYKYDFVCSFWNYLKFNGL